MLYLVQPKVISSRSNIKLKCYNILFESRYALLIIGTFEDALAPLKYVNADINTVWELIVKTVRPSSHER